MSSVSSERGAGGRRRHRRAATTVKESLRELSMQLSLVNLRVSTRLELRGIDFDCLELLNRHGPLGPSALARRAGLHPATMTGILDRLERGGWIARERDPDDRRAVIIRALRERNAEVYRLFAPMNATMDEICAGYDEAQLELITDFLRRTTDAGRDAHERMAAQAGEGEEP